MRSRLSARGLPRSPRSERPEPNRSARRRTWRMSPLAKASTKVVGTSFIRKSTVPVT